MSDNLYKLKEVADITMGQSPKSEFYNENGVGTPFLQGNSTFGDKYPTIEKYTTKETRISEDKSILMSVRAPVGDININPYDRICIGRGLCSISMHNKQNEYLYYYLKSKQRVIQSKGTGTVFSSINKKDVENIEIYVPEIDKVKALTLPLKLLDDKIENNNAIIANLEEQAQAIFKSWFVDFEPYQDEEFVDSDIGRIPHGFEIIKLGDLYKLRSGFAFKSRDWSLSGSPIIKIKDINPPTINYESVDFVNDIDVLEKARDFKVYGGEIIIALTGATTGKFGLVPNNHTSYVNQRAGLFFDMTNSGYGFIYGLLNQDFFLKKIIELAQGSAQSNLSPRDVNNLLVPYEEKAFNKIKSILNPIAVYSSHLLNENSILERIRDTLLPKLISGEIRVGDVELEKVVDAKI